MDDILQDFLAEAEERLSTLDQDILLLEQNGADIAALTRIFRSAHNIKGSCGFLQLHRLSSLAHAIEAVLVQCRDYQRPVTPPLVSLLLAGFDQVRYLVKTVSAQGAEPEGDDSALIAALARAEKEDDFDVSETQAIANDHAQGAAATSLRVHVDVLDNLMALTGELVLARNQMLQEQTGEDVANLALPLQRMHQLVSGLQTEVLRARMQPVMQGWRSLPRLLYDTASAMKKHARLEMSGGDTALDRHVLEMMRDPLAHLLRNAVAHGIETPAERMQSGKPAEGVIRLSATYAEGSVTVIMADDGRGLEIDKIGAQAVAQNLVTAEALSQMQDDEVIRFIFMSGFSTQTQATMLAGRGVGLDVVRAAVEKIGGTVSVETQAGRGTAFSLRLPLTLAILPCIIISAAGQQYALPQTGVSEMLGLAEGQETLAGQPVLRLRGDLVPLLDLAQLFNLPAQTSTTPKAVILRGGAGSMIALKVDDIDRAQDVVVKPLPAVLQGAGCFLGSALLGGGGLALIVDTNRLVEKYAPRQKQAALKKADLLPTAPQAAPGVRLLLFRRQNMPAIQALPLADVIRLVDMAGDGVVLSGAGKRLLKDPSGTFIPVLEDTPQSRRAIVFQAAGKMFALAATEIIDICEVPAETISKTPATTVVHQRLMLPQGMAELLEKTFLFPKEMRPQVGAHRRDPAAQKRVLLVDDSPFFCKLMTPLLQHAGYDVVAVESAQEALRFCQRGDIFEAVISDIEMPGMSGLEFAKHIRGRETAWRSIPLLALSAHATQRDEEQGLAAGFDAFINKFDRDGLLFALRQMKGAA